jgi:hypothetical protein
MEIWKTVPSLPEYEASSLGRVRRVPFEAPMPHGGVRQYGGQITTGVWREADKRFCILFRGKNYKVARMVCEAFHGPAFEGAVCMHLDEDSKNNRPENLAWGTQKENLNAPGFKRHCKTTVRAWNGHVLSDYAVREIRARANESRAALAREYGVSPSHVSNLIAGRARAKC